MSKKISIEKVRVCLISLLTATGLSQDDAQITAEIMIDADLRGYNGHGIERIFQIMEGFANGTLNIKPTSQIIKDCNCVTVIDAGYGLGQPIAHKAMKEAVKKAKQLGVGIVGVINSGHLGILSYYSEIASKDNCIGIVISTSSPAVVVAGGKIKTFGTNPISFSLPSGGDLITADFATSKVSRTTLLKYASELQTIPDGWAVDKHGITTNDPKQGLEGGLETLDAGIKGTLISMLISILAGNLIGGVINPLVTGTRYMDESPNKGDLFLALDISHFTSIQDFINKTDALVFFINTQKAIFRIPGQGSKQKKEVALKEGIELSPKIYQLFNQYNLLKAKEYI